MHEQHGGAAMVVRCRSSISTRGCPLATCRTDGSQARTNSIAAPTSFAPPIRRWAGSERRAMSRPGAAVIISVMFVMVTGAASGQELEPRAYSPSPVGVTFVLAGFGRSEGGILFDPALDVDNVHADLWIATVGVGHTFSLAGRQARILAVAPVAWGSIAGDVAAERQRQD